MPSGWREIKLGDVTEIVRGSSPRPKGDPRYYGGTVPRLMVEDITRDGKYVTPKVDFLTEDGAKLSRPMKKGDLVVVCSGTVGVPSLLAVDACIHDGFLGFREIDKSIDKEFLYYLFLSLRNKFESSATHGGIFTNLTTTGVKELLFTLPPKNEQEKIAKILSTWDEAIEKLDRIIERKEKRLQGFGQKLLFNGTNKYRLDDLCTPKQWKTISSKELLDDGIPVFGANSWIGFYSEANHQEDCIAVTCRGATCGTVNYVKGPSYITGNSMALDSLKNEIIDRNFLYFYLRTLGLNSIISGSAQPQITGAAIGKVELTLPSLADQIKVSSILMDATKEVDGFKKLKDKITTQKQGLMQQLLTGKKRVKV